MPGAANQFGAATVGNTGGAGSGQGAQSSATVSGGSGYNIPVSDSANFTPTTYQQGRVATAKGKDINLQLFFAPNVQTGNIAGGPDQSGIGFTATQSRTPTLTDAAAYLSALLKNPYLVAGALAVAAFFIWRKTK